MILFSMPKKIFFLLIFALGFWIIYAMNAHQLNSRPVEICIDWDESRNLLERAAFDGNINENIITEESFLRRCKSLGVSSVALRQERLEKLIASGNAVIFSDADLEHRRTLNHSLSEHMDPFYLWIPSAKNADQILSDRVLKGWSWMSVSNPTVQLGKDYAFIKNPFIVWEKMLLFRLGTDPQVSALITNSNLGTVGIYDDPDTLPFHQKMDLQSDPEKIFPTLWFWDFFPSSLKAARLKKLPSLLESKTGTFILFENQYLFDLVSTDDNIVRAHTISEEDMKTLSQNAAQARWIRAIKERSCRFLYYRWNFNLNLENNLENLQNLCVAIKRENFALQRLKNADLQEKSFAFLKLRMFAAWMLAGTVPLLGLFLLKRQIQTASDFGSLCVGYFQIVWTCVSAGIAIYFLLPDAIFKEGLAAFVGIKLVLVAPIILSGFILFSKREIAEFLSSKVSAFILLAMFFGVAALFIFLQRSGNSNWPVSELELSVRLGLEKFLGVRPRFKEILFGYPWIILGIYFCARINAMRKTGYFCLWIGMFGLVSIVNSFCHLHTPISISLLRSFHGFWIGSLLGSATIYLLKKTKVIEPVEMTD